MNGFPNFDLGSVQPENESEASNSTAGINVDFKWWDSLSQESRKGNESQASNSVGFNPYLKLGSLAAEPNMDSRQSSGFSHTLGATRSKNFPNEWQVHGDSDSDNTEIQNFIRTLQGCTYDNFESNKEDSWNEFDSTKLTLAPPLPDKNTPIQYVKISSNNQVDAMKVPATVKYFEDEAYLSRQFATASADIPRPKNIVEVEGSHVPHGFGLQDTFSSIHPIREVRPFTSSFVFNGNTPTPIITGEYDAYKNLSPTMKIYRRKQAKTKWTVLRCAVILCFIIRRTCRRRWIGGVGAGLYFSI